MKPGSFNSSDMNFKRQGMAHMWGDILSRLDSGVDDGTTDVDEAAAFMLKFFEGIVKERYTFFIEKDGRPNQTHRNPLEGSYPYGRTGRSPREALAGFCHFKYR